MTDFWTHEWPVVLGQVPIDHGYLFYAAISRRLTLVHEGDWQIAPVLAHDGVTRGTLSGHGVARVRGPKAPMLFTALDNQTLTLGAPTIEFGKGVVKPVESAPRLLARLVTIKHATTEEELGGHVCERFQSMLGRVPIYRLRGRRVLRIANKKVVGFGLEVSGLDTEESLTVQREGIGGRRRMGGGVFLPTRSER